MPVHLRSLLSNICRPHFWAFLISDSYSETRYFHSSFSIFCLPTTKGASSPTLIFPDYPVFRFKCLYSGYRSLEWRLCTPETNFKCLYFFLWSSFIRQIHNSSKLRTPFSPSILLTNSRGVFFFSIDLAFSTVPLVLVDIRRFITLLKKI